MPSASRCSSLSALSEIGWASIFIFLPFLTVVISIITRASNYGDEAAIASHLADFPWDAPFIQAREELPCARAITRRAASLSAD